MIRLSKRVNTTNQLTRAEEQLYHQWSRINQEFIIIFIGFVVIMLLAYFTGMMDPTNITAEQQLALCVANASAPCDTEYCMWEHYQYRTYREQAELCLLREATRSGKEITIYTSRER